MIRDPSLSVLCRNVLSAGLAFALLISAMTGLCALGGEEAMLRGGAHNVEGH